MATTEELMEKWMAVLEAPLDQTVERPTGITTYVDVNFGEDTIDQLKDDAAKWAKAFGEMAVHLGYSEMDEGWLIGWFANAIERSYEYRRNRK